MMNQEKIKAIAWDTLYLLHNENLHQMDVDLMDSILQSVEEDQNEHRETGHRNNPNQQ